MSLSSEDAEMCKGKFCTNLLTSWHEAKNGLCDLCLWDQQEHNDKLDKERKISESNRKTDRKRYT